MAEGTSPLVFVHGSATDHVGFLPLVQKADWGRAVHLLDRPGHGHTPAFGTTGQVLDAHAMALGDWLHSLGETRATWVGSSMGGVVVLRLAQMAPERVAALVLREPPISAHQAVAPVQAGLGCELDRIAATQGDAKATLAFVKRVVDPVVLAKMPKFYMDRLGAFWPGLRQDIRLLAQFTPSDASLSRVKCPVTLVVGKKSHSHFAMGSERLARVLPQARLHPVDGSHMMHLDAMAALRDLLRNAH